VNDSRRKSQPGLQVRTTAAENLHQNFMHHCSQFKKNTIAEFPTLHQNKFIMFIPLSAILAIALPATSYAAGTAKFGYDPNSSIGPLSWPGLDLGEGVFNECGGSKQSGIDIQSATCDHTDANYVFSVSFLSPCILFLCSQSTVFIQSNVFVIIKEKINTTTTLQLIPYRLVLARSTISDSISATIPL
jgi:hypothetical protein